MQHDPFTHLFSINYLQTEPYPYKNSLASQKNAFTPQDEVCLHFRLPLRSDGKIAYSFSISYHLACTTHPSLGNGAQSACFWRGQQLWSGFTVCNTIFVGFPGESQSYICGSVTCAEKFLMWRPAHVEQPMTVPLNCPSLEIR